MIAIFAEDDLISLSEKSFPTSERLRMNSKEEEVNKAPAFNIFVLNLG